MLHLSKTSTGLNHTCEEEQNKQRKAHSLQRTVYRGDGIPDAASFELGWRGCEKPEYLPELLVPHIEGFKETGGRFSCLT